MYQKGILEATGIGRADARGRVDADAAVHADRGDEVMEEVECVDSEDETRVDEGG